jgi:amino acid transporter
MATLPVLALSYAANIFGPLPIWAHWTTGVAMIAMAVMNNILGVELVGITSFMFCIIVCTPPAIICIFGLSTVGVTGTGHPPIQWESVAWLKLITCLMWNTAGFDDVGALAAEVHAPSHVFPKALSMSILLVIGMYVATLEVATSIAMEGDSFLVRAGVIIGGPLFGLLVIGAALLSTVGQLNSLMCCSTREVVCMATQNATPVPRALARLHPRYGTPVYSILAYGLLLIPMLSHSLTELVVDTIFLDCFTFLMQFATWIRFRWETRYMDKLDTKNCKFSTGFRLPLDFIGVAIWAMCPIVLCVTVVILAIVDGRTSKMIAFLLILAFGECLYSKDVLMKASRLDVLMKAACLPFRQCYSAKS